MTPPPSPPFWSTLFTRIGFVAALAGLAILLHGATLALVTLAVGFLFLLMLQTRELSSLNDWLNDPKDENFPSAGGASGEVFLTLARHLRADARQRESAEADLRFFKEAVEALPDGVVLLDPNHQTLWCNRQAENHLGLARERDTGRVISQIFRQPGFNDFLQNAESGKTFAFTANHGNSQAHSFALKLVDYGAHNHLLVSFDTTERLRAEAMRRDFVANVSHELRTPLTVVSGFLEHFTGDAEIPTAQRQRFVKLMNDQSQRMLRLVDDLLTLSRLDADDMPPSEEVVPLAELIPQLVQEAESLSAGRHVISLELPAGATLRGNRHELRSALGNLVSNAVRYTPEGGSIVVRWQRRGLDGVFAVEDSGVGIPAEHIPRLTERFYRVDKGRSRETGGTGLGLAIVKHVLLRHQARLEVASVEGQGSTFSAVFPEWRCNG
ncbi:MAG TPA: phosphate regulon sensor histidine kinase PhoR [Rhodocyclaceae bacterium]|nr:phosphate regulon sensor histidine kinase PhoR [Rhodocyclaceae bacterium]